MQSIATLEASSVRERHTQWLPEIDSGSGGPE